MPSLPTRRVFDENARTRLAQAARDLLGSISPLVAAYLYGSAARGEPARDLDVALLADGSLDVALLEPIAAALEREGAPSGPSVDVRLLNGASPRFQVAVLRDGHLLFERNRTRRLELEASMMSRWADFQPTWDVMRRRLFERWARG